MGSNTEQKVEAVVDEVSAVAGIAGETPSPASLPLLLVAGIAPLAIQGLFALINKIHHSKDQAAAVKAANDAVDPYVDTTSLYSG